MLKMQVRLNYESKKSKEVIAQVLAFLLGRPLAGATQKQIESMLKVSHGTANRFIQHLVNTNQMHVARKARATNRGHLPAIYKYGPRIETRFSGRTVYQDLPLNFFGRKRPMNNVAQEQPKQIMTDWYDGSVFAPGVAGPFQCTILDNRPAEETMHMRWWNGTQWSYPLQPEHEDGKGGYYAPADDYFMTDADVRPSFAWRGFCEDQDEL
jgi:hypothetical protein